MPGFYGPEFDTEWMRVVKRAMASESIYHTFRRGILPEIGVQLSQNDRHAALSRLMDVQEVFVMVLPLRWPNHPLVVEVA